MSRSYYSAPCVGLMCQFDGGAGRRVACVPATSDALFTPPESWWRSTRKRGVCKTLRQQSGHGLRAAGHVPFGAGGGHKLHQQPGLADWIGQGPVDHLLHQHRVRPPLRAVPTAAAPQLSGEARVPEDSRQHQGAAGGKVGHPGGYGVRLERCDVSRAQR
eukprot:9501923-Pyramimonas_sp.AAC.1